MSSTEQEGEKEEEDWYIWLFDVIICRVYVVTDTKLMKNNIDAWGDSSHGRKFALHNCYPQLRSPLVIW